MTWHKPGGGGGGRVVGGLTPRGRAHCYRQGRRIGAGHLSLVSASQPCARSICDLLTCTSQFIQVARGQPTVLNGICAHAYCVHVVVRNAENCIPGKVGLGRGVEGKDTYRLMAMAM